jgi:putative endonuclease
MYFIYILASKKNGTLYVGVTSDLIYRMLQHKNNVFVGFTTQYNVKTLVYYEVHSDITEAIKREKNIKSWRRDWKISLIERDNPYWKELHVKEHF